MSQYVCYYCICNIVRSSYTKLLGTSVLQENLRESGTEQAVNLCT
jgi:hypothetical protein